MAYSENRATLIGHLGQDPEIRRTQDGRPIVNLSLATSETWRDRTTGERKEKTEWHRIVVFNEGLAKVCEQYLKKGSYLRVVGTIRTRSWEDQAGQKRYATEIHVQSFGDTIGLLDKMTSNRPPDHNDYPDDGRPAPRSGSAAASGTTGSGGYGGGAVDLDDEISF